MIRISLVNNLKKGNQQRLFRSNRGADVCRAVCKGPIKRVRITSTFMRVTKVVGPADGHKKDVDSIRIRMGGYETYKLIHSRLVYYRINNIVQLVYLCNTLDFFLN